MAMTTPCAPSTTGRRRTGRRGRRPAAAASTSIRLAHHAFSSCMALVLLGDPMPGVGTAKCQPGNQQRQRPGMSGRRGDGPATGPARRRAASEPPPTTRDPHHAQAEPDAGRGVAPRLQLARRLRAHLSGKPRIVMHAATSRTGGGIPPPISRSPNARSARSHPGSGTPSPYCVAELLEIPSAECPAHGDQYLVDRSSPAPLHPRPRYTSPSVSVSYVRMPDVSAATQSSRRGQEPKRSGVRLGHDTRYGGLLGEDSKGQQNREIHDRAAFASPIAPIM